MQGERGNIRLSEPTSYHLRWWRDTYRPAGGFEKKKEKQSTGRRRENQETDSECTNITPPIRSYQCSYQVCLRAAQGAENLFCYLI